jgi:hypothetical protein
MDTEEVIFRSLIRLPSLITVGNCDDVGEYSFEALQQVRHNSQPDMKRKRNETKRKYLSILNAVILNAVILNAVISYLASFQVHRVPCLLLVMGAYRGRL